MVSFKRRGGGMFNTYSQIWVGESLYPDQQEIITHFLFEHLS